MRFSKASKGVLSWFLGFTSIGGLSQHNASDNQISKACWLLLFAVGAGWTIWHISAILTEFGDRGIITTFTKESEDAINFPAVTLCNLNKVHCYNLHKHIVALNSSNNEIEQERIEILCSIYIVGKCRAVVRVQEIFTYGEVLSTEICSHVSYEELFPGIDITNDLIPIIIDEILDKLPIEDAFAIAHQPDQMIKSCVFQGLPNTACNEFRSGARKFVSPNAGVCYSFNFHMEDWYGFRTLEPPLKVALSGDVFGLAMDIDIQRDGNLLGGLTPANGILLILHEPFKYPQTSTQGMVLKPHTENKIGLEITQMERQEAPYTSNCKKQWDEGAILPNENIPYNDLLCQSFCIDDIIQAMCNCTLLSLIEVNRNLSKTCKGTEAQHPGSCMNLLYGSPEKVYNHLGTKCTHCRPQCEETLYKASVSQAVWPTSSSWMILAQKYNVTFNRTVITEAQLLEMLGSWETLDDVMNNRGEIQLVQTQIETAVTRNFLRVEIFFSSKSVTKIVEKPKYDWQTMMSSIGGVLSLYLGISLVAMFEVMELSLRLLAKVFARA